MPTMRLLRARLPSQRCCGRGGQALSDRSEDMRRLRHVPGGMQAARHIEAQGPLLLLDFSEAACDVARAPQPDTDSRLPSEYSAATNYASLRVQERLACASLGRPARLRFAHRSAQPFFVGASGFSVCQRHFQPAQSKLNNGEFVAHA